MIQSMTAFARAQDQGPWGSAVCEIRSINHRYLETSVRLPDNLQSLESPIRECIKQFVQRGKIECTLRFIPNAASVSSTSMDIALIDQICKANETIAQSLAGSALIKAAPVNTMEILKWPGVLKSFEIDVNSVSQPLLALLTKGLQELVSSRQREGAELKNLLLQRLEAMKLEVAKVRQQMPDILRLQRERLENRFKEAKVELDTQRLEQEIVLFAQKIDVSEELERLDTHVSEIRHILKHGGVVGRKLDFIMQELNREANTLGSKSVNVDTTRASVEIKVLTEQMREQVQNVE